MTIVDRIRQETSSHLEKMLALVETRVGFEQERKEAAETLKKSLTTRQEKAMKECTDSLHKVN